MRGIMIGAISLAAAGLVVSACTTHETRIVETPAIVGAAPGSTTTVIRTNRADPVVIESEEKRDIIVKVD
jgi:hypothetical protein